MADPNRPEQGTRTKRQRIQDQLDEALANSSPASDPVSLVTSQHEEWDDDEESTAKK